MSGNKNQITKPWMARVLKAIIFGVVALMISRTISHSADEFGDLNLSLEQIDLAALMTSSLFYSLGLLCFACVWHKSLRILGQSPTFAESVGSYYLSQLGKYVPGKALVVLIRSERVHSKRTALAPAVTAVFIETLAMMAVGAILAGLLLLLTGFHRTEPLLLWISLGLALTAGIPSIPPVFRSVIRLITRKKLNNGLTTNIANLTMGNMLPAWGIQSLGWLLLGASMYSCLTAIPTGLLEMPLSLSDTGLMTATVALAMVAGFLSLLPGGAGVREYIILTLLAPSFGVVAATVSALLLRVTWLASELSFGVLFYILMNRTTPIKN